MADFFLITLEKVCIICDVKDILQPKTLVEAVCGTDPMKVLLCVPLCQTVASYANYQGELLLSALGDEHQ